MLLALRKYHFVVIDIDVSVVVTVIISITVALVIVAGNDFHAFSLELGHSRLFRLRLGQIPAVDEQAKWVHLYTSQKDGPGPVRVSDTLFPAVHN